MKRYTLFIKLRFTGIDSTHKYTDGGFSSVVAVSADSAEAAIKDAWEETIKEAKEANKDCKLVKIFLADISTLAIE